MPKGHGFGAAAGAKLAQDGRHVEFDGVFRNIQPRGDFLIAQAGGEHLQNFEFPAGQGLGKLVEGARGRRTRRESFIGMGWVQDQEAARHGLQRGDELLRRNIAGQCRANARAQRLRRSCGSHAIAQE